LMNGIEQSASIRTKGEYTAM